MTIFQWSVPVRVPSTTIWSVAMDGSLSILQAPGASIRESTENSNLALGFAGVSATM